MVMKVLNHSEVLYICANKKPKIMKKTITILSLCVFAFSANAQWLGSYWSADDLNGNTHILENHINNNEAVLVDISAHWCSPCFSFHQSHAMAGLYHDFGPEGTNEVMVFLTDVDAGSSISILQGGSGSQGDWLTGTEYPVIGPNGQGAYVGAQYATTGVPTLFLHCGSVASEHTISYDWWTLYTSVKGSCPSAFTFSGADASLLKHDGVAGCPAGYSVEVELYNASSSTTLTSADIELRNPSGQLIATENWTGSLAPLNRTSVVINHTVSLAGIYKAKVVNPNGALDSRTTGDEEDVFVNFGYSNAYWDAPLSINIGLSTTSWYLKDANGLQVGSGYGGVIGTNGTWGLEANQCYTLRILNGNGDTYEVTDGRPAGGVVIASGSVDSEDFKTNFSTGAQVWTGIKEVSEKFNIYPNPVNDVLTIDGDYTSATIYDVFGKVILTINNQNTIDVTDLSSGVYFININTNNATTVKKITIAK
jgi:hypothetical protein